MIMANARKNSKRNLTQEELLYYLENRENISDIEFLSDDDDGWQSDEIFREQRNNDILDVTIDKNNGNENQPEISDVEDVDLADEEERLELISNGENMGENDKDELKRNQTNF
uniref:Uncharacterized protein LOC114330909 n=1 Tax=Diabrotica virgifera virgifera TaxID=50390 RepID=A0A6P7FTS3_DIAVI